MTQYKIQKKYLETPTGSIYYFLGSSSAHRPTIVFLHGLASNHTTWLGMMEAAQEHGYNSLALDLRGHGLSTKQKKRSLYKFPVLADDLAKIIHQERLDKVILVGYSFGGPIALQFSAAHPQLVQKLIIISADAASPAFGLGLRAFIPLSKGLLVGLGYLLIWQKRRQYYYYQHALARGYWHSTWVGLNTMPISINLWMLAEMISYDFRPLLPKITMPTVVVRGEDDPFITQKAAESLVRKIPDGQVVTMKSSNHFIASRYQAELAAVILEQAMMPQ